jgi:hypothetical protein
MGGVSHKNPTKQNETIANTLNQIKKFCAIRHLFDEPQAPDNYVYIVVYKTECI